MRAWVLPFSLLAACTFPDDDDKPDDGDTGGLTGDSGDSADTGDTSEPSGPATVRGTVSVSLYQYDAEGDVEEVSWAEATGEVWVFGALFVAAYTVDDQTDEQRYLATQTFASPSVAGEGYELVIEDVEDLGEVRVWATLDYSGDMILGTGEPSALSADTLTLEPGRVHEDVDLEITSPFSFGGGGYATPVTLSGDAEVTQAGELGACVSMLYSASDWGPYFWSFFTPEDDGTALTGTWSFAVWDAFGSGHLHGACDTNLNDLIDPADAWGTVVDDGHDDNPVALGSESLSDLHLVIPFAGARSTSVTSVDLDGVVHADDGFDSYGASATLYVVALRSPPSGELAVADLDRAYDVAAFSGDELTGSDLAWTLTVPPWKTVYLWAFADTDGDGTLNEAGEPLGNAGGTGRVTVEATDQGGLGMNLATYAEDTGDER